MITNVIFIILTESLLFLIIFTTFVVNNLNNIYMKELVSKIQEVYATFSTDAALQIEKATRPQVPVPARLRWNWKTDERVS